MGSISGRQVVWQAEDFPVDMGAMAAAARWISRLSHPFLVPIPTLLAALRLSGEPWGRSFAWAAFCIGIGILPPTILLVAQRRCRDDRDWYVTVREQRFGLYGVGLACIAVLLATAIHWRAPRLLVPALLAALVATAVGALLNRVTKVSVHTGVATGCAVLLAHVEPRLAFAAAAAVALVAWSRLRLGHHTPLQVALGAAVAAASLTATLALF
jgi:membrane-associated phospholipid phosphatase